MEWGGVQQLNLEVTVEGVGGGQQLNLEVSVEGVGGAEAKPF